MKKYSYRLLALVVLILNMNKAEAGNHYPFVYKKTGGDVLVSDYIAFLKGVGNPTQNTWWTAPSGDELYIYCNPAKHRAFVNSTNTEGYTYDDIKLFTADQILGDYQNTGISKTGKFAEAINAAGAVLPDKNYFGWPNQRAIAKANCLNEQWLYSFPKKEKPVVAKGKMLYSPCLGKEVEMAPDGHNSKDSAYYLTSDGVWEYFTGLRTERGREFLPVPCKEAKVKEPIVNNYTTNNTYNNYSATSPPPPTTRYTDYQEFNSMGRMYNMPWYAEAPPMPNYQYRQRSVYVNIGLQLLGNIIPNHYNWNPVPGSYYQGQQVWQGNPFTTGGDPVYSQGNPFNQGQQFYNQNPGGNSFQGDGYVPGTFVRTP